MEKKDHKWPHAEFHPPYFWAGFTSFIFQELFSMFALGAKVSVGHAYYFIYYLLILNRSSFNLVLIQSFLGSITVFQGRRKCCLFGFSTTCQVYPYFPNNIWLIFNKYLEEQHWLIILEFSHLRRQFNLFSKMFREVFLSSPIYMRGFHFFPQPSLPSTLSFFHFKILKILKWKILNFTSVTSQLWLWSEYSKWWLEFTFYLSPWMEYFMHTKTIYQQFNFKTIFSEL